MDISMKKKSEDRWYMGWQSPAGTPIEEILESGIKRFLEKFFCLPEEICVHQDVDLKNWGNINIKRDDVIYCRGIVHLLIPVSVEIDK
jgi:hypothetical protein